MALITSIVVDTALKAITRYGQLNRVAAWHTRGTCILMSYLGGIFQAILLVVSNLIRNYPKVPLYSVRSIG